MGWLTDLLKEVPMSAVMKERLALKEEQFDELKADNRRLTEEIGALKAENAELKRKLADPMQGHDFILEAGALWRVKGDETVEYYPYCTNCKHVMADMGGHQLCIRCQIRASFGSQTNWNAVHTEVERTVAVRRSNTA